MPKLQLTDAAIRKTAPRGRRVELWDAVERGLLVRVSPDGSRVFYLRYRANGSRRRLKLGYYARRSAHGEAFVAEEVEPGHGPLTLSEARAVAAVQRGRVASRHDPQLERRNARRLAEANRALTVGALAAEYVRHQQEQGRRSWREEERQLERDVLPVLRDQPAGEVTAREVQRVLDRITRRGRKRPRGGRVQANRTRTLLVSLFNYALQDPDWREAVRANPALLTRRPLKRERPRDRVLSDEELRRLWEAAEGLEPVIAAAYRLRLLTGQRWTEVRSARWADLSSESVRIGEHSVEVRLWRVPAERTKNGREHLVPLSQQAEAVLDELERGSEWVFPSPRRPDQHLGECGKAFGRWREAAEVEDFRGTDLRRTFATGVSRLAVRWEVKQALLNHLTDANVTRRYDRYDFLAEKRQAIVLWGDHVQRVVSGEDEASNLLRMG